MLTGCCSKETALHFAAILVAHAAGQVAQYWANGQWNNWDGFPMPIRDVDAPLWRIAPPPMLSVMYDAALYHSRLLSIAAEKQS